MLVARPRTPGGCVHLGGGWVWVMHGVCIWGGCMWEMGEGGRDVCKTTAD